MLRPYDNRTKLLKWKSKVLVKMQRLISEQDINLASLSKQKRELNKLINQ